MRPSRSNYFPKAPNIIKMCKIHALITSRPCIYFILWNNHLTVSQIDDVMLISGHLRATWSPFRAKVCERDPLIINKGMTPCSPLKSSCGAPKWVWGMKTGQMGLLMIKYPMMLQYWGLWRWCLSSHVSRDETNLLWALDPLPYNAKPIRAHWSNHIISWIM